MTTSHGSADNQQRSSALPGTPKERILQAAEANRRAQAPESLLRLKAQGRGYMLLKSGQRKKTAPDFGKFMLIHTRTNTVAFGCGEHGPNATEDEIADFLESVAD